VSFGGISGCTLGVFDGGGDFFLFVRDGELVRSFLLGNIFESKICASLDEDLGNISGREKNNVNLSREVFWGRSEIICDQKCFCMGEKFMVNLLGKFMGGKG
jgi:hypothetical protein